MDSWASVSSLVEFSRVVPGCRVLALLEVNTGILLATSNERELPAQLFGLAAAASAELFPNDVLREVGVEEATEIVVHAEDGVHVLAKLASVYGLVVLASCEPTVNLQLAVKAVRDVVSRMELGFEVVRQSQPPEPDARLHSGFRELGTPNAFQIRRSQVKSS